MEIRTEKKLVERVVDTYIAVDGKEFNNKKACMDYEFELEVGKIMEEVKKFQFIDDGYVPCDGQENMESHFYEWYKVENAEQLEQLQSLYNGVPCVENFPEYICCERYDETDYDIYAQTLTGCKEYVKLFFDKFGIDVEFKVMEGCFMDKTDCTNGNFVDDAEKMRDFKTLSREEFLKSYSYLTEAEYDNTMKVCKMETRQSIYDEMCRVLTEWETQEAVDDDLYNMLVKIQNNWETVITATEQ